ncbi:proline-rich protein 23B-like [Phacochoerus africanus]|uniref:proline-rich protein 23B-like n=1 Tax=Phacochoerus africanus TaxID=41426 RepID=UPI001FD94DC8|nr:proline-rich protein 23B-like [Phacochoerus africanus]
MTQSWASTLQSLSPTQHSNLSPLLFLEVFMSAPNALMALGERPRNACSRNELLPTIPSYQLGTRTEFSFLIRAVEPGGPGPAKRRRPGEPSGPESESESESESEASPRLHQEAEPAACAAAAALPSVVGLAAGCALYLALGDVDLLLEPEPTAARQVSVGDRLLVLVPEALLGSGAEGAWGPGLPPGAFLSAPGEALALGEGFFCVAVPEVVIQAEAQEVEDAAAQFQARRLPCMKRLAGDVCDVSDDDLVDAEDEDPQGFNPEPWPHAVHPSPQRRSPHHHSKLDLHLLAPLRDVSEDDHEAPLQCLPASPCPGPQGRPPRPQGPLRKARRRLILD